MVLEVEAEEEYVAEVVSREGVKEIEDRFKSDMRVIKVITDIIK